MNVHSAVDTLDEVLAEALKVLPEPVMLCDDDHILFANEAAQRLLGGSRAAEVESAPCKDFFDPEYADVNAEQHGYVLHNLVKFTDFPLKVHTLDGQILRLRVDMRPVSFDGMTVVMVTLAR